MQWLPMLWGITIVWSFSEETEQTLAKKKYFGQPYSRGHMYIKKAKFCLRITWYMPYIHTAVKPEKIAFHEDTYL